MTYKTVLIDPSLFTLPYDLELYAGLSSIGLDVTLIGRPLNEDEYNTIGDNVNYIPYFYKHLSAEGGLLKPLLRMSKGVSHIGSMISLRKKIGEIAPDVIHFQWSALPLVDQFLLNGLKTIAPIILTVHDTMAFNGSPGSFIQRIGFTSMLHCFDQLIVHTKQGKARLLAMGVSEDLISIIPHGPLGNLNALMGKANTIKMQPLAKPKNVIQFLAFGKIKPYKGIDLLIQAVSKIPPAIRQKYRFIVAGKPYLKLQHLYDLATELDVSSNFDFRPGYLSEDEVDSLFAESDVFLFPYREIEASGVLMRSLASCKPIIASRIGLFAELLVDGEHGKLTSVGDLSALADAIVMLGESQENRKLMSENLKQLIESLPSWDQASRSTLELYSKISGKCNKGVHVL